jgi:surface antigen
MKNNKFAALFLISMIITGCAQTSKVQSERIELILEESDQKIANDTLQNTLEIFEVDKVANWNNPATGNSGTIIVTKALEVGDKNYCREYTKTATIGGKTQKSSGKACRKSSGNWQEAS